MQMKHWLSREVGVDFLDAGLNTSTRRQLIMRSKYTVRTDKNTDRTIIISAHKQAISYQLWPSLKVFEVISGL